MTALRYYQDRCLSEVEAKHATQRRGLLVMPTGAGKTVTAMEEVRRHLVRGDCVLWVTHRSPLIPQVLRAAEGAGIEPGLIKAGWAEDRGAALQVASVQTLRRRERPYADLVVIDETHRRDFDVVHEWYPHSKLLGLTATPIRLGGKTLHGQYDFLVVGATYEELLQHGSVVPFRAWMPDTPDLSAVKQVRGDFDEETVTDLMSSSKILGSVVEQWEAHCRGTPTILFAVNHKHSGQLNNVFFKHNIRSVVVDGNTDDDTRALVQAQLVLGKIDVIINVGIYTEGLDIPEVMNVMDCRPTQSTALWMQMCNRGCRPAPGKDHFRLLSFTGNLLRHGSPQMDHPWNLNPNPVRGPGLKIKAPPVRMCPKCFYAFPPTAANNTGCPQCNTVSVPKWRKFNQDGKLIEVTAFAKEYKPPEKKAEDSPEQKERRRLYAIGRRLGMRNLDQWVGEQMQKWRFKQAEQRLKVINVGGQQVVVPKDHRNLW